MLFRKIRFLKVHLVVRDRNQGQCLNLLPFLMQSNGARLLGFVPIGPTIPDVQIRMPWTQMHRDDPKPFRLRCWTLAWVTFLRYWGFQLTWTVGTRMCFAAPFLDLVWSPLSLATPKSLGCAACPDLDCAKQLPFAARWLPETASLVGTHCLCLPRSSKARHRSADPARLGCFVGAQSWARRQGSVGEWPDQHPERQCASV